MLTAWPTETTAVVLVVGPHEETSSDVYTTLLAALGLDVTDVERNKPPCCGPDDLPPVDADVVRTLSAAVERIGRRRRSR